MTSTTEGKPLNSTDKRALGKLVDNDFAALEIELRQFAADVLEERLGKMRSSAAKTLERAETVKAEALALLDEFVKLTRGKSGVVLEFDDYHFNIVRRSVRAKVDAVEREESRVRTETDRDMNKALALLQRRRLGAQRQVLTAGISDEAKVLLDSIPTAQTLMGEATSRRAVTA